MIEGGDQFCRLGVSLQGLPFKSNGLSKMQGQTPLFWIVKEGSKGPPLYAEISARSYDVSNLLSCFIRFIDFL